MDKVGKVTAMTSLICFMVRGSAELACWSRLIRKSGSRDYDRIARRELASAVMQAADDAKGRRNEPRPPSNCYQRAENQYRYQTQDDCPNDEGRNHKDVLSP